jgi:bla regulator protein blaR1
VAIVSVLANHMRRSTLFAIVAGPIVFGLVNTLQIRAQSPLVTSVPLPSFEVASIKPSHSGSPRLRIMLPLGRFAASATVKPLIAFAYGISDFQLSGGESWISSETYDIDAKEEDSQAEELQKLPSDQGMQQIRLMIQSLLADRFKLKVSHETKELPEYALVVAKGGPKLQGANPGDTYPNGIKGPDGHAYPGTMRVERGHATGQALPMASLVMILSKLLGRTVLDQTGLKGKYDFTLQWTPDESPVAMVKGPQDGKQGTEPPPPESSGPSIFTAIQEQLGLKLVSTKGPVEIIVIDHIERPSEN